jgi:hypothetical protein
MQEVATTCSLLFKKKKHLQNIYSTFVQTFEFLIGFHKRHHSPTHKISCTVDDEEEVGRRGFGISVG